MRRIAVLLAVGLTFLAAAAVSAPVALAGDPCFHDLTNRPAPTTGATRELRIDECTFAPTVAYVPVGTLVVWKNAASQPHEIVGSNLTWGAHGKLLEPADTMGWTFDRPGVYAYSCMLHPGMTGAIVVGDAVIGAGAPAESSVAAAEPAPAAAREGASDLTSAAPAILGAGMAGLVVGLGVMGLRRRRFDKAA